MKKKPYLLILLVISLIISSIIYSEYLETRKSKEYIQNSIDITFRSALSNVLSSLSMEVSEYSYRMLLTSVSNAASLSELTTYEDVNDNLDITLHNMYISLREEKSREKVLLRVGELREIFIILVQDPVNQEAIERLIKVNNETFFRE